MMVGLWRRQAALVVVGGALFALSWALLGAVEQTEPVRWLADGTPTHAFDAAALRRLTWAVGAAGVAAAALLAIAVWHVARVLMLFKEQHGNLG